MFFFIFLNVWGVPGGFPEVRVIILDMGELHMMVFDVSFDMFLMIAVWKSDFLRTWIVRNCYQMEGPCPEEWCTFGTRLVLDFGMGVVCNGNLIQVTPVRRLLLEMIFLLHGASHGARFVNRSSLWDQGGLDDLGLEGIFFQPLRVP